MSSYPHNTHLCRSDARFANDQCSCSYFFCIDTMNW